MTASLIDTFIEEECTPYVRGLVCAAAREVCARGGALEERRLEFNRFTLTLRRDGAVAIIEDVLDATNAGTQIVALHALIERLSCP